MSLDNKSVSNAVSSWDVNKIMSISVFMCPCRDAFSLRYYESVSRGGFSCSDVSTSMDMSQILRCELVPVGSTVLICLFRNMPPLSLCSWISPYVAWGPGQPAARQHLPSLGKRRRRTYVVQLSVWTKSPSYMAHVIATYVELACRL